MQTKSQKLATNAPWVLLKRWECHGWVSARSFINSISKLCLCSTSQSTISAVWHEVSSLASSVPLSSKGHAGSKQRQTKQKRKRQCGKSLKESSCQRTRLGQGVDSGFAFPCFPSLSEWTILLLLIILSEVQGQGKAMRPSNWLDSECGLFNFLWWLVV